MSRLLLMSDLHLGHNNIHKYRPVFSSAEEHHETIFDNLATTVRKRDSLYLLGDVAFTHEWLKRIKDLECNASCLVVGNHDTERGLTMRDMVDTYTRVSSLFKKRNFWFSHCPIHPDEMRSALGNFHGHTHFHKIDDPRYVNLCVEHTDYMPITFEMAIEKWRAQNEQ